MNIQQNKMKKQNKMECDTAAIDDMHRVNVIITRAIKMNRNMFISIQKKNSYSKKSKPFIYACMYRLVRLFFNLRYTLRR